MKTLARAACAALVLAFALQPVAASAQTAQQALGYAVSIGNRPMGIYAPSIEERCAREGESFTATSFGASVATATGTINTIIAQSAALATVGKVIYIDHVTASLSAAGVGQVQVLGDASARFGGWVEQFAAQAGSSPTVLPVRQIFRGFQLQGAVFSLSVRNNETAGSVNYYGAMAVAGCKFTDDLNWNAAGVILGWGDSTWGGTGPTKSANMLPFLIKDYYRSLGKDVRLVLKSVSGSTSSDHETWRAGYWGDVGPLNVKLGMYNVCINDAAGTNTTAYVSNVTAWWTWFHTNYPTAQAIVFGCAPLNNGNESNAALFRTAASNYVSGVGSPYLHYINLGGAFTASDSTKYSDGTTHANDTGHGLEWTVSTQPQIVSQSIAIN